MRLQRRACGASAEEPVVTEKLVFQHCHASVCIHVYAHGVQNTTPDAFLPRLHF